MLSIKQLENLGSIQGAVYDFPEVGDSIPMHEHGAESVHISIVTNGEIRAFGSNWEIVAGPGKIVDFQINQPHEIVATQPNTRIINLLKHT